MKQLFTALLLWVPLALLAQVKQVSGTYTYFSDPSQSYNQAKAAAIMNAKMQTLAKEFGTLYVQNTLQQDARKNGEENNYFIQLNAAEVKGEWIEDTKTPLVERKNISEEGVMELEVTVWGKARAISNEASEFKALTLRNKPETRHADTEFFEDDDLFLYFTAPTDGYVAAYLIDEKATAYCLLPYKNDEDGQQPVKHGKEYIFFSKEHADPAEKGITDEIYITCDDPNVEHSQLYILFSPNPYKKAVDTEKLVEDRELPRQLSYEDFTKWMGKLCARDQKMGRQIIPVTFRKK